MLVFSETSTSPDPRYRQSQPVETSIDLTHARAHGCALPFITSWQHRNVTDPRGVVACRMRAVTAPVLPIDARSVPIAYAVHTAHRGGGFGKGFESV
jgi:hypothetical protein